MNNVNRRELFYTISMLLAITGVVFCLNLMILSSAWSILPFRGSGKVKAVTIAHGSKPHYVNAKQKLRLIALLNEGDVVDQKAPIVFSQPFKKLTIHKFEGSAIDITPIGTLADKLVLAIQNGQEQTLVVEKKPGQIQDVINKVFEE